MTPFHHGDTRAGLDRQHWFAGIVLFAVAPLVLFFSGFFTTDFLLSGVYTWPRTSRIVVLTLTIGVLAYEFVYKEQRALDQAETAGRAIRALVGSCLVPYALGVVALLALARN